MSWETEQSSSVKWLFPPELDSGLGAVMKRKTKSDWQKQTE
jgi:hypothetical protein